MFNEFSIVATAVSSFNNAALFAPYFFVVALFSLPLFYIVWLYSGDIFARMKWKNNVDKKFSFWSVICLVLWMLIFGGNYAVIRDGISLLPVLLACVVFVSMAYITNLAIKLDYLSIFENKKIKWTTFFVLVLLAVASAKPDLFGILLQLSAILCGVIVGARFNKTIPDTFMSALIFGVMTALILMQPEYFRFGQLGNLTFVHLAALLLTGSLAITTLTTKYTNARGKIYESAYIKLKWLCRIIGALALILFVLTESVPVFVGLIVVIGIAEMLTIYHSKKITSGLTECAWGMMLVCFGVMIICPAITGLGIIYLSRLPEMPKAKDFISLL